MAAFRPTLNCCLTHPQDVLPFSLFYCFFQAGQILECVRSARYLSVGVQNEQMWRLMKSAARWRALIRQRWQSIPHRSTHPVFPPPLSEPQKHFEPRRTETAATSTALRSKVPFIYQTGGDGTNWYKVKNQFGDEPGLTPELVSDICRQKRL